MTNKYNDLREWLEQVEAIGELAHPLGADWNLEIGAISEIDYKKRGPALLFDQIKGYPAGYRLLTSSTNSARRMGLTLRLGSEHSDASLVAELRGAPNRWEQASRDFDPVYVETGPVFENVMESDAVDLMKFPAPLWHELDGGRYIGTGVAVATVDPESGWVNLGAYRTMLKDRNHVNLGIHQGKHGYIHIQKWMEREGRAPVVIHIGMDPLFLMLGGVEVPTGVSELNYAGAIRGEPLKVVKSTITGLPIIADAEIVLEGWIKKGDKSDEGPFGEWTGYYASGVGQEPFLRIERVLHRNNPIMLGSPPARPPHDFSYMRTIMKSALIFDALVAAGIPEVKGVYAPECGGARQLVVVAIRQRYAGHARQAAMVASQCHAAAYMGKYTIVVDEDIDVTNLEEVMWAVCTRTDPSTSIDFIRRAWASKAEPMLRKGQPLFNSRAVIDACRPYEWIDEFPKLAQVDPGYLRETEKKWSALFTAGGT
ncbi:MAG: UbiD family decarboxylase [Betaproteobacteria bacterium]|nr:UbiD family decarboxylase [Betaproteobacteria bacterium]